MNDIDFIEYWRARIDDDVIEPKTHSNDCWLWHPLCALDDALDELEQLRAALAIASGMISTMPQYEHDHPMSVMEMLLKEAAVG